MAVMSPLAVLDTARSRPRAVGYYLIMLFVVAVFTALWLFEGHYLFTAWFPSLYDELTPINGVAAGAFMTLMLGCALASFARPKQMHGPSKVLVVGAGMLGILLPLAFVLSDPLVTGVLLIVTLSVVGLVVWLHPARSELDPTRRFDPQYPLLGLTVLIAVPFLWLALDLQWSQMILDDEVANRWFYGGLAMYLSTIVVLAGLASVDGAHRRTLVGATVFLASMLGLVSVVNPGELHSFGVVGGGLVLVWCVAVILAWLRSPGRL